MADSPTIRTALLHYADVRNFGDVLFPLLAAQELRARLPTIAIEFVSPTGLGPDPSLRYDAVDLARYDAVVLAGGELIHRHDQVLSRIYERFGVAAIENPTDLVFGWSDLTGPYKAWVGLGVPALTERARASIVRSAPGIDMIVVRGSGSARRLRDSGVACTAGPDIGWMFSRLVTDDTPASVPYAVVHALPGAVPDDLGLIIQPLERLQTQGLEVVLLPLSTCWEDHVVLARLADRSGFRLVDYREPDLTKLNILAHCDLYIGQSMHGFISTMATGHPAGLCFPVNDDKFLELLRDNSLEDVRVESWEELPSLIDRVRAVTPDRVAQVGARNQEGASAAFDTLAANIRRHAERRRGVGAATG